MRRSRRVVSAAQHAGECRREGRLGSISWVCRSLIAGAMFAISACGTADRSDMLTAVATESDGARPNTYTCQPPPNTQFRQKSSGGTTVCGGGGGANPQMIGGMTIVANGPGTTGQVPAGWLLPGLWTNQPRPPSVPVYTTGTGTGRWTSPVQSGETTDPDIAGLLETPVSIADFETCPDCVLDAIAVVNDLLDIFRNGFDEGRGVALVVDGTLAFIPGLPAIGGTIQRGARNVAVVEAIREGIRQHGIWKASKMGLGWVVDRALPNRMRPDGIEFDFVNRVVRVHELKPNSPTGQRLMDTQLQRYIEEINRIQAETGTLFGRDIRGWSISPSRHYYTPTIHGTGPQF
jgi:hypothetical protein